MRTFLGTHAPFKASIYNDARVWTWNDAKPKSGPCCEPKALTFFLALLLLL